MPKLTPELELERCPHCNIDKPSLIKKSECITNTHSGSFQRYWRFYSCTRCGGIVTAWAPHYDQGVIQIFPSIKTVDISIPNPARSYLEQAYESLHAPSGSIMLAASSIDSMLKEKGYKEGSLNKRINEATKNHLITEGMAKWAHHVRLDANEQRHSDEVVSLPTEDEARKTVDFAFALAEFLFVLPSKVAKGLAE